MTISKRTYDLHKQTKSFLLTCVRHSVGNYSQNLLLEKTIGIIENFVNSTPKSTPKIYTSSLWAYLDGAREAAHYDQLVFLYDYNGQLYRTKKTKDLPHINCLPDWSDIPREVWDNLSDYSGLYWKTTLVKYS